MLPPSSSFSKKLPTCRQGNPSATLVLSWMNSLDNGSKPCQRPAVDLSNSGSRNNYPLLSTLRQSGSNESYTTASKSDNMIGCSYIQLSLDLAEDDTKDIISSSTPEQGRQSPQPLAWEDGEMVDFHLKIPSQTSIRHQRRSDLRERFQIHGPTRRVGILQNLLSTVPTSLHKSKSLPGSQLRRSAAPSTSLDESFANCSSV
jgi:hypothetical protein